MQQATQHVSSAFTVFVSFPFSPSAAHGQDGEGGGAQAGSQVCGARLQAGGQGEGEAVEFLTIPYCFVYVCDAVIMCSVLAAGHVPLGGW